MKKVGLVDGTNIVVRSAHAAARVSLSSDDGIPTAALLIFINSLSKFVREEQPTHLVVAWDGGKSTYRQAIWDGYKANRGPTLAEEPTRPFAQVKEFCSLVGIHHVERDGFEADDIIANYWRQIRPSDTEIVIFSGDKDFLQLVDDHCTLVRPMNSPAPFDYWTPERMVEEMGCEPRYFAQIKALMGDTSDGIPGLAGIGPKRAVKMMEGFEWSWLQLIDHGALTDEQRTLLLRNLALMDLRDHCPPTPLGNPPEFRPSGDNHGPLLDYLGRYGLASVFARMVDGTLWKDADGEA